MSNAFAPMLVLAALQDPASPEYEWWSKFKAGSSVSVEVFVAGGAQAQDRLTYTLLETGDKELVLEMKGRQWNGAKYNELKGRKVTVRKGAAMPAPRRSDYKTKESEEEIEVCKKKLRCRVIEETWKEEHAHHFGVSVTDVKVRTWISPDVPGGVVRWERTHGGQENVRRVVTGWEVK
ncbi:MAG: hypothetical protein HYY17_07195 [Planctomycetes bacterium]|nr:hypothetical protein [Planctomycetota bacterium]